MDWRNLLSERSALENELQALSRDEESSERARRERQARCIQIAQRLGYISAVEQMLENLPVVSEGVPPPEGGVAVEHRISPRGRQRKRRPASRGYGAGIGTVRKVLKASNRDLNPSEIRQIAADEHGVSLNAGSIRSALRRMADKTGEAVRKGDRYAYARSELPLDSGNSIGHKMEGRPDAEAPSRPS